MQDIASADNNTWFKKKLHCFVNIYWLFHTPGSNIGHPFLAIVWVSVLLILLSRQVFL